MQERKWWKVLLVFLIGLLPIYSFFIVAMMLLPVSQWITAFFFAGLVTLSLLGCGIGGGYDSGCIWHYHGAPEHISRPDIESLRAD